MTDLQYIKSHLTEADKKKAFNLIESDGEWGIMFEWVAKLPYANWMNDSHIWTWIISIDGDDRIKMMESLRNYIDQVTWNPDWWQENSPDDYEDWEFGLTKDETDNLTLEQLQNWTCK